MRGYIVLSGGGSLAIALSGCLEACEQRKFHAHALAGTSSGSFIAVLSAVGYTGLEIRELLTTRFGPSSFLDDGGDRIEGLLGDIKRTLDTWRSRKRGNLSRFIDGVKFFRRHGDTLNALWTTSGMYAGHNVRAHLLRAIQERIPSLSGKGDITFAELDAAGAKPVKVVAADLVHRSPVVYPDDFPESASVLDAVRASMSYPFVLTPPRSANRLLSDGGLASNLPAVVFAEEHALTHHPIIAFDLAPAERGPGASYDGADLVFDVAATALSASDKLVARLIPGLFPVNVQLPKRFNFLSVRLSPEDIKDLHNAGVAAALPELARMEEAYVVGGTAANVCAALRVRYGSEESITLLLDQLVMEIEKATRAQDARACIMLPDSRGSVIVTFRSSWFLEDHSDSDLELGPGEGCGPRSFFDKQVACQIDWSGMGPQKNKLHKDRKVVASVPVYAWSKRLAGPHAEIRRGALCIDTSSTLERSGWGSLSGGSNDIRLASNLEEILKTWAVVFSRLLS